MGRRARLPETGGRLSWKRRARAPLWHANCFRVCRQARRKLNRDPAAITSLSVACRYASRPPSVPTNPLPIKNLASRPGSLAFGTLFPQTRNSQPFSRLLICQRALTNCQPRKLRLSLCGNRDRRGSVTSTKFVTRGVTFYVVSPSGVRRFAAALYPFQIFFRAPSSSPRRSPKAVTRVTRLC